MKKYQVLRRKYPQFIYEGFDWKISGKNLEIIFAFRVPPHISFSPRLTIENIDPIRVKKLGQGRVNNLVFNLGLIEMLSYWKTTCSPKILVRCGSLAKEQIRFWHDLIIKGMGQYFFENRIDFAKPGFLTIVPPHDFKNQPSPFAKRLQNRFLVPVGGGKDSAVTLEILKSAGKEINCFAFNPTIRPDKAIREVMQVAGCKTPIRASLEIDKRLFTLSQKGFLTGHTPFSAYLAFLSVLTAVLFDYRYLAFSNERSANEGNVSYLGRSINHQYSKSFEFEQKFRQYARKYLAKEVEYFSLLRPLYELQIARLFVDYPQYFKAFLSCNQALATKSGTRKPSGKWCGSCPKCLFVFACLYPFLEEKTLIGIFGQNLFEKRELLPILQELIGEKRFKPFECVGTAKESLVALYLGSQKVRGGERPFLLNYFEKGILPKHHNLSREVKRILGSWNRQNNLPAGIKDWIPAQI